MIKIENIYYMLAYAYRMVDRKGYANLQPEKFEHIESLLAELLYIEMSRQIKLGLAKDYQEITEPLTVPRGKIKISETIKQNTLVNKRLVCERDEYVEDTHMNRIVKSTMLSLVYSDGINIKQKRQLKKLLFYFDAVQEIRLKTIRWKSLQFTKHHASYRVIIGLCEFIARSLLLTETQGTRKISNVLDDQSKYALYERFVLEYFKKHHPQLRASSPHIDWHLTEGTGYLLPRMKTDVTLNYKNIMLIIDTKFYQRTLQNHSLYNSKTIHSHNLYQLHTYVTNKAASFPGEVQGMLLYAKTDEELVPDHTYYLSGKKMSVTTLDLSGCFDRIREKLDGIAENLMMAKEISKVAD